MWGAYREGGEPGGVRGLEHSCQVSTTYISLCELRSALSSGDEDPFFWQHAIQEPQFFSLKEFRVVIAAPHIANLMIAEDFCLSYSRAHQVRLNSEDYGNLHFPVEGGLHATVTALVKSPVCITLFKQFVKKHKVSSNLSFRVNISIHKL
ncbi:hypothetical protein HYPSUDRAFT_43487 [Hypholoma sublateritium FD-334 SS-4]|uniref:Uncharacterized protein n=1 Tax=Hypholoma sublateritium (strain FD-334 SS-4) TaxID=945553 RepID=A0A0D2L0A6_HYPSF|nr:hypothetical protein HYPSUDRAFT_43487 [Hypholoma sublateritium FD-334 SS-4]